MVTRLLYWLPKSRSGWVYKSWRDWDAECGVSRSQVKRVHGSGLLEAVGIEGKIMKVGGAPTVHYRIDLQVLFDCVASCLNIDRDTITMLLEEGENRQMETSETDQSTAPESPNQKGENKPIHNNKNPTTRNNKHRKTNTIAGCC